jgi:lysophospholipase L1-like esterase
MLGYIKRGSAADLSCGGTAEHEETFMLVKARLSGCCMAAVLLVTGILASSASATKPATNYIGLGDSLAFGYTQQKFEENFPTENPEAFEGGYVTLLGKKLHKLEKAEGNKLSTVNLGCPGELTDGLIGHNPAFGGGAGAEFNPCDYHNVTGFPLHFEHGSSSQLEAAYGIVSANPSATKVVTINIGSNDELKVVHMCEDPAYLAEQEFETVTECIVIEAGEEGRIYPGGVFHHIIANTGQAIGVLRAAGYAGPVAVLGFYNPQTFILPGSDGLQKRLNEFFEATIAGGEFGPGVVYANPFPIINPQENEALEHETICKYTEMCNPHVIEVNNKAQEEKGETPRNEGDIHPTPQGYKKLAKLLYKALGH